MSERNTIFKDITTFCHFIKVVKNMGTNTIITQKFSNELISYQACSDFKLKILRGLR